MSDMKNEEALAAAKAEARKAAAKTRAEAFKADGGRASTALAQHGLGFLHGTAGTLVSGFYPYKSEIDLLGLLGSLAAQGWSTCLPVVLGEGQPLQFRAWTPGDATEAGAWGIPIPPAAAQTVEPDVMLVPLLAFDRLGYRLGYGGGFYDRTIAALGARKKLVTIGVAFAAQEVEKVVRGEHDQPLDWVLTEQGPIKTAQA